MALQTDTVLVRGHFFGVVLGVSREVNARLSFLTLPDGSGRIQLRHLVHSIGPALGEASIEVDGDLIQRIAHLVTAQAVTIAPGLVSCPACTGEGWRNCPLCAGEGGTTRDEVRRWRRSARI